MAKQFAEMLQSSQDRQFAGLLSDVLDKIDERFTQLDQDTQDKLKAAADEITRMKSAHDARESTWRTRFQAMADHYAAGGRYVGPFRDADQAAQFGRFVGAVARGPQAVDAFFNKERFVATVAPTSGEAGGVLLPEQLAPGLINNAESYGVLEHNVRYIWPVGSASASRIKRAGGATVYYPDYGLGPSESALKFGRVRVGLTRYSALAFVDRWMVGESTALQIALGDYIAGELGYAIALAMDTNGFMGTGTSTYARTTGLFQVSGGLEVVADAADDTFQEVIDESVRYLTDCAGKLPDVADTEECKWYMHRELFWKFLGVRDANDRPIADILTKGERPQRVLCGYPCEVTQVAPKMADSAASTVMAVLGNVARSTEIFRHVFGMELRTSEHVHFTEGELCLVLDCPQRIEHVDAENMTVRLKTGAGA
jgi:HK97 family phage major capsid protein